MRTTKPPGRRLRYSIQWTGGAGVFDGLGHHLGVFADLDALVHCRDCHGLNVTDRPNRPSAEAPPTIGYLRGQGVTKAYVSCNSPTCHRGSVLTFDAINLPDDTPFPEIAIRRRWVCAKCGCRKVSVMPRWPVR